MYQDKIEKIKQKALTLNHKAYNKILEQIGDTQVVLLGEATHGTQEFYEIRSEITQMLIQEKGFNAIAIEGDWPDAYNINEYINGKNYAKNAPEALKVFERFPTWMWQNMPMINLVDWLKDYNESNKKNINFFGLDLYSLYQSIDKVISYLENIDPKLAQEAKEHYNCLEKFRHNPQYYGYSVMLRLSKACQDEVINELKQEKKKLIKNNKATNEQMFYILQNAKVIKNSEEYYRSLFINEISNWNLRDTHMMETLESILSCYKQKGIKKPKVVVWAHNSHIGNAKATQMGEHGEINIGQLAKEKFKNNSYNLGFTTYNGTVSAASDWNSTVERKTINNAILESYEYLFHQTQLGDFLLTLEDKNVVPERMLERAIGVIYAKKSERISHYFYARLAEQFNAVIHIDKSNALEPIVKPQVWIDGEVPETYPTGL